MAQIKKIFHKRTLENNYYCFCKSHVIVTGVEKHRKNMKNILKSGQASPENYQKTREGKISLVLLR